MARTVDTRMHAHRRDMILDAAAELVISQGYEETSVHDIITRAGISKGAFYHYFGSKPALLEGLVERITAELVELGAQVVEDPMLRADEKLRRFFLTMTRRKAQMRPLLLEVLRVWRSDGNAVLRRKLHTKSAEGLVPMVARIIRAGVNDGVFTVADPTITAELVWGIAQDLVDSLGRLLLEQGNGDPAPAIAARVTAYTEAIERVLAMEIGTLRLVDDQVVAAWVQDSAGGMR